VDAGRVLQVLRQFVLKRLVAALRVVEQPLHRGLEVVARLQQRRPRARPRKAHYRQHL